MNAVAPNLTSLIGEMVGSKLIAHAGSLTNLAKYPASTIQILGAEKALFRALKTKGKTPKYGLIFNSSFIGRAGQKNKGRISRYLANKCAIASRIDSFSEGNHQTNLFGEKLRQQMEERLQFLATGAKPKKNTDAMKEVLDELKAEGFYYEGPNGKTKKAAKDSKKKAAESDEESEEDTKKKQKKDKKKDKKRKTRDSDDESEEVEKPKKKKQKIWVIKCEL